METSKYSEPTSNSCGANRNGSLRNSSAKIDEPEQHNLSRLNSSESSIREKLNVEIKNSCLSSTDTSSSSSDLQHSSRNTSNPSSYNWQSSKCSLKQRLSFIFNSEILSDVHFIVGREPQIQRIPAHKFVLSIGSVVFDTMFNENWTSESNEIELPDIEPAAFLALLRFLYTDDVSITSDTVITILYTAKKYAVPSLENLCVDFLLKNLCPENAFTLLTQARLFDEDKLVKLCLETIDSNTADAVMAEGFIDIDLKTLCLVLERNTLIINEIKLFDAVCRWAKAECVRKNMNESMENQQLVLEGALSLIRFPLMSIEEFASGVARSGLLDDREVISMFLYFVENPKPPINFSDTPRLLKGKEVVINRFEKIQSGWGYCGSSDRIGFSSDCNIQLIGFGLYGSMHGAANYYVTISLINNQTGDILCQNSAHYNSDGSKKIFRALFKDPVELTACTNYTGVVTMKGPESFYGDKGTKNLTLYPHHGGKITITFNSINNQKSNGTTVDHGQIPELLFYL